LTASGTSGVPGVRALAPPPAVVEAGQGPGPGPADREESSTIRNHTTRNLTTRNLTTRNLTTRNLTTRNLTAVASPLFRTRLAALLTSPAAASWDAGDAGMPTHSTAHPPADTDTTSPLRPGLPGPVLAPLLNQRGFLVPKIVAQWTVCWAPSPRVLATGPADRESGRGPGPSSGQPSAEEGSAPVPSPRRSPATSARAQLTVSGPPGLKASATGLAVREAGCGPGRRRA